MNPFLKPLLVLALVLAPVAPALAAETPELPEGSSEAAPPDEVKAAPVKEVDTPKQAPVVPGKDKGEVVQKRFLWGNFLLGAFGGALLGGAAGILFSGGETDKQRTGGAVGCAAGLVAGGVLSVLLGATTPLPPKPPKVESALGGPVLALGPQGLKAAWRLEF